MVLLLQYLDGLAVAALHDVEAALHLLHLHTVGVVDADCAIVGLDAVDAGFELLAEHSKYIKYILVDSYRQ